MPRIGTPRWYTAASSAGAPSTCTLFGPPLRINPAGRRAATSAAVMVDGTISEYTRSSRTRRAISCAYWAPKSTTRTVSCTRRSAVRHEEDDRHHEQSEEHDDDHGAHDRPHGHALGPHPAGPRGLAVAVLRRPSDHLRRHGTDS